MVPKSVAEVGSLAGVKSQKGLEVELPLLGEPVSDELLMSEEVGDGLG